MTGDEKWATYNNIQRKKKQWIDKDKSQPTLKSEIQRR